MKITPEIAGTIHRHDEMETLIGREEKVVNSCASPPAVREFASNRLDSLATMRARLAAQGFFMSPVKAFSP